MSVSDRENPRSLLVTAVLYFGAALFVGLPVMYVTFLLVTAPFVTIAFPVSLVLLAASFLVGMWVAERVTASALGRIGGAGRRRPRPQ